MNYCTADYTQLHGSYDCDCGKTHDFTVKCLLVRNAFTCASAFISNFTPFLSRIVVLYDDERLALKFYDGTKKDYRVGLVKISYEKKEIESISLPEDCKLIVAVGSFFAVNAAKYVAALNELPVVVASLPYFDCLSDVCVINEGGVYVKYVVPKPQGYVFELNAQLKDEQKAELFGQIVSRLNSAFDYYCSALFGSVDYCPFIAGGISDIAAQTALSVKNLHKNSHMLSEILLQNSLKLALIASTSNLTFGGETQCALCYSMLNGNDYSQGELQFVFAAVLAKLYKNHARRRSRFTPPPDNNYRLERISELLSISEYKALNFLRPQLSGFEASLIEYKIREYGDDLIEKLSAEANIFTLAFRVFKRLYGDDGYSLSTLKSNDLSLSIALAADVVKGNGMLTVLKRLGELDRYIV